MYVNMLAAGSSQHGLDQREVCAVLVSSQKTSHLEAGRMSPVDVTRIVRARGGGCPCGSQRQGRGA